MKDIPISNYDFFQKCPFSSKFSNCYIIIAQTTHFKNIQICNIYFHYGLCLAKLVKMSLLPFFERYISILNLIFFQICQFLSKFSNCRIILAQTTYIENIQYCKIYFHYGPNLNKTSYNDSASFFWKIFPF